VPPDLTRSGHKRGGDTKVLRISKRRSADVGQRFNRWRVVLKTPERREADRDRPKEQNRVVRGRGEEHERGQDDELLRKESAAGKKGGRLSREGKSGGKRTDRTSTEGKTRRPCSRAATRKGRGSYQERS